MSIEMENLRKIGFDILVNHFEPFLRRFIIDEVLIPNFNENWRDCISVKITERLKIQRKINIATFDIHPFFEELLLSDLKKIINRYYSLCSELVGDLTLNFFTELMNELNRIRARVVHPKENFSVVDIENIRRDIKSICRGRKGKIFNEFIDSYEYQFNDIFNSIKIIDPGEACINNLPPADYDLDGGFVGRKKEIKEIKNRLYSNLDRIITIMGAGGVGKTAVALEIAKNIVEDIKNPFKSVIWFSAKEEILTDLEIVKITPDLTNLEHLINDILEVIDKQAYENYQQVNIPIEYYMKFLYNKFENDTYLLIIDNLESILSQESLINFIEDIPCKVLITSRIGLGKLERPYNLKELKEKDSMLLFKNVVLSRNIKDLIKLDEESIIELVNRTKRYPLALKWSIGQYLIGKDINKAFPKELPGESLISQFCFDNVFSSLNDNEKMVLYAMNIWNGPLSEGMLKYMTSLDDDDLETVIRKLKKTSLIFQTDLNTKYSILSLTSGFIKSKLSQDEKLRVNLEEKKYLLHDLIDEGEKLSSVENDDGEIKDYKILISSLGIKTPEEKIAFNYVKKAKECITFLKNNDEARKYYLKAQKLAPDLGYIYGEFSKFEFYNERNREKGIELARMAVEVEPVNFHHWINYGRMLRLNNKGREAIKILKKARELNPNSLVVMNQLAMAFTINKEYEKSENQLLIVQEKSKELNLQIYSTSLIFRIKNYIKWTTDKINEEDYDDVEGFLNLALEINEEAHELNPNYNLIYYQHRELHFIYGLLFEAKENYKLACDHFEIVVGEVFNKNEEGNFYQIIAKGYYHLALIKNRFNFEKDIVLKMLNMGLKQCKKGTELHIKLKLLVREL